MPYRPRPVGTCILPDGSRRTVYRDMAGRHFILDDNNRVVYGEWWPVPVVVQGSGPAGGYGSC